MKIHNDNYQKKQEGRIEYYQDKAEKKKEEANKLLETARKMGEAIPFGQPILIGHHSEQRDRNYRDKIDNKYRKGYETLETSNYYNDKAKSAQLNHAIRTDDPEAIKKLKDKLIEIDKQILEVKEHNKKCKGVIKLSVFGGYANGDHISNTNGSYQTYAIIKPDKTIEWQMKKISKEVKDRIESYIKTGKLENPELTDENKKIESYVLAGYSAEKGRIKKRIEQIETLEKLPDVDETINNIKIYTDEGRVKIDFGFKPSEEIRTQLKQSGFRWSPFNQTWQAYIHQYTIDKAKEIIKGIN